MNPAGHGQEFLLGAAALRHQDTGKIPGRSAEAFLFRHLAELNRGLILLGGISQEAFVGAAKRRRSRRMMVFAGQRLAAAKQEAGGEQDEGGEGPFGERVQV